MIISDLTYLETVEDSKNLEGGWDFGVQIAGFNLQQTGFAMGNYANATGAGNYMTGVTVDISSFSVGALGLGLPNP
ncbi:hypothetical protein [Calothrix sp. NIES-3974]|uniref:hypothetical protein n=1 Tax=Calothrix sp. NIES-3974 TaxID=2005462 RepID=UPI000B6235B2|nr:hypothetical protein [Calothrix sp. NIES-3974]BAZ05829.1 hypothetical protein NIES3974_24840 [Calothrix sp. NIES-3974]